MDLPPTRNDTLLQFLRHFKVHILLQTVTETLYVSLRSEEEQRQKYLEFVVPIYQALFWSTGFLFNPAPHKEITRRTLLLVLNAQSTH